MLVLSEDFTAALSHEAISGSTVLTTTAKTCYNGCLTIIALLCDQAIQMPKRNCAVWPSEFGSSGRLLALFHSFLGLSGRDAVRFKAEVVPKLISHT